MLYTLISLIKMLLEFVLGLTVKLFIENGRVSREDILNDYLFWVPGMVSRDGHGVTREAVDSNPTATEAELIDEEAELAIRYGFYLTVAFTVLFVTTCLVIL